MIGLPSGNKVWLAAGVTDLRRGFDGLAALVQTKLEADPFAGHLFVFRGRRGDLLKILWWDGQGMCLAASALQSVSALRTQKPGADTRTAGLPANLP